MYVSAIACSLLGVEGMTFIGQLTAGAMAKGEAATAIVALGSGILAYVSVAVYLSRRAYR
jgi:hypothetical protein